MHRDARLLPETDPTPIFEFYRGSYGTELLLVALHDFRIFVRLAHQPRPFDELAAEAGLSTRAANVLVTALRAMKLVDCDAHGYLNLTAMAREHMLPTGAFYVGDYLGLSADAPGVREMAERLGTGRPAGQKPDEAGAAFIYRDGLASAMESEASARAFTLALAGRARNVAPHLAAAMPLEGARVLLDVGGGTGIYSIACAARWPDLRCVVWDRPEVLKVATDMIAEYGATRVELAPGDMFRDPFPVEADAILLSNILHDWDVPEISQLLGRCADALVPGGIVAIHDVYLNDSLDGPLPVALYSAALFGFTEGRAYSAGEYRALLADVGLVADVPVVPTLIHCGLLIARKPDPEEYA